MRKRVRLPLFDSPGSATAQKRSAFRFAEGLRVGSVVVNDSTDYFENALSIDPWTGMDAEAGSGIWNTPNCDGSTYQHPQERLSAAAAYSSARNAEVYALCNPNDPTFADACEVYQRFQACYAAARELAAAGSTFPIPETPGEVATSLAGTATDAIVASEQPVVPTRFHAAQFGLGLIQVIGIFDALSDANYACAGR